MRKGIRTLPALLCTLALLTVAGNLQATDRLIISKVGRVAPHTDLNIRSKVLMVRPGDQLKFKAIVDYVAPGFDPNNPGTVWAYRVSQKSTDIWHTSIAGAHWSGPNTKYTIEYTDFFTVPALTSDKIGPAGQEIVFELRRVLVIQGGSQGLWTVVATNSVKYAN